MVAGGPIGPGKPGGGVEGAPGAAASWYTAWVSAAVPSVVHSVPPDESLTANAAPAPSAVAPLTRGAVLPGAAVKVCRTVACPPWAVHSSVCELALSIVLKYTALPLASMPEDRPV